MESAVAAGRVRPLVEWVRRHTFVADTALAVVLAGVALLAVLSLEEALDEEVVRRPDSALEWMLLMVPVAAVPFRRLTPALAVIVAGFGQATIWVLNLPDYYLATAFLLYSAAVHGGSAGRRTSWSVSVTLSLFTTLGVAVGAAPVYAIPIVALFSVASTAVGVSVANRHAYTREVEQRVIDAERTRKADQDRALAEERNRIARELHDVVAHGLSVIVVQSAAAQRILDRDPEGAATALHQIEQTGRTALGEMRQVLAAIRTDPDESWRPAPGLGGIEELVRELGQAGLDVQLAYDGGDLDEPLPGTVGLTAYRIVQESLTNVLKHGGDGVRATVGVLRTPTQLELSIVDNGRGASATDAGGHGLRGMQERVEVFGGEFSARPRLGGGFAVKATLPLDGSPGGMIVT